MHLQRAVGLVVVSSLLVLPAKVWGQAATGAIAGSVKDTSGAVLPGVTVEASSPALIEKARAVVTDDRGEYRIVELRPGTYTITFSLPGFATVRREGIELTSSFTANVNAELKVGGLEETVTVSGQTPVVDVSSARQQTTVGRAVLDAIPTTKRLGQYASFIPGATYANPTSQDSGGTAGEGGQFAVHGQHHGDQSTNFEGMGQNNRNNDIFSINAMNVQEVVVETGATSAEASSGGVQVNVIPKDGGNTFSGSFSTSWATPSLQADNIGQDLLDRAPGGLQKGASINYFRDNGGALGGPIKKDKFWFYHAQRYWATSKYIQGSYYNKLQNNPVANDSGYNVLFYEADLTRRAHADWYYHDTNLRLTFQATPKQKIVGSFARQDMCNCPIQLSGTGGGSPVKSAPEAARVDMFVPIVVPMASWTYPATNKLLFDAAASLLAINAHSEHMPEVGTRDVRVTDVGLNVNYGAAGAPFRLTDRTYNGRFAVSYVTGSHTFKTGFTMKYFGRGQPGRYNDPDHLHGARSYTFQTTFPNGVRTTVPRSVTIFAQPFETVEHTIATALYAQDQWAVNKLTINAGLRYDAYRGEAPAWTLPRGIFVPERPFQAVSDVPNYKNLDPRLSVIYDLFGNGKTAVKASIGRYVPVAYQAYNNPATNQATSTTRTWNDINGNFVPDCNLADPLPNGECQRWNDPTFGSTTKPGTNWDPKAITGFNTQFSNWQISTSVQHELRPGVALNVGYFRTWYDNFLVTDNPSTTAADYTPFCVTVPTDSRLPRSGQQLCGFANITAEKLPVNGDNLRTFASNYGKMTEIYNGVDITVTARFGKGGQFSGGASIGRTVTDACEVAAKVPEGLLGQNGLPAGSGAYNGTALLSTGVGGSWTSKNYCGNTPPLSAGSQVKFLVVYPLPFDLQASAIYQNMPGIPIRATYQISNANVRSVTDLGRNLASSPISVELMDLGERYENRLNQLDLRLSRLFTLKRLKVKANIDVANVLNRSQLYAAFVGYGSNWLTPYEVMGGRLARLSAQLDF